MGGRLITRTLEEIRLMAVQRVWEGERPSVVIASYGFARPVIYRWLREARGKGRGLRALRSRKGTGRPRRLAPKQEQQVFRWINGNNRPRVSGSVFFSRGRRDELHREKRNHYRRIVASSVPNYTQLRLVIVP